MLLHMALLPFWEMKVCQVNITRPLCVVLQALLRTALPKSNHRICIYYSHAAALFPLQFCGEKKDAQQQLMKMNSELT